MESIEDFNNLKKLNFQVHSGILEAESEKLSYEKKHRKIRLYDEDHVIKKARNNFEYLQNLVALNIEGVNSPKKICVNTQIPSNYFIVSKYLRKAFELDFFEKKTDSFDDILSIFINIMKTLDLCHKENFYMYDIHSGNILIDENLKSYFFDFDNSLFIKGDRLIFESNDTKFSNCVKYREARECFTRCFGKLDDLESFYNSHANLLINYFQQYDKERTIIMLLDIMYMRLNYDINPYCGLDKNSIKRLGLSRSFRQQLINTFINGEPFNDIEYLLDELQDMQGSRLARKLNR